jgi:hypothetical protein
MAAFIDLLNRNYCYTGRGRWRAKSATTSNHMAGFSLALETTRSGPVVSGVMRAGIASQYSDARVIGALADALSPAAAVFRGWAHFTGWLPEPSRAGVEPEEVEVHGKLTL